MVARKGTLACEPAAIHLTAAALRWPGLVARRQRRLLPGAFVAFADGLEPGDALETRHEQIVTSVAIEVQDTHPVCHGERTIHRAGLNPPLREGVTDDYSGDGVIGSLRTLTQDRDDDQFLLPRAVPVRPAQPMCGRQGREIVSCPLRRYIRAALKPLQSSPSAALAQVEFAGNGEFQFAVPVQIVGGEVYVAMCLRGEEMFFPGRVLVPGDLVRAAGETEDIGPSVAVDVGDRALIHSRQRGDDMFAKPYGRGNVLRLSRARSDTQQAA